MTTIVNNVSKSAKMYIVARECDGSLWYWGSWDEADKAYEVAREIDGIVVANG